MFMKLSYTSSLSRLSMNSRLSSMDFCRFYGLIVGLSGDDFRAVLPRLYAKRHWNSVSHTSIEFRIKGSSSSLAA